MIDFSEAGKHIAEVRSDLGRDADYWTQTLERWAKELESFEDGASIGTAGFTLRKCDGFLELDRHVFSFYDDDDNFDWRRTTYV